MYPPRLLKRTSDGSIVWYEPTSDNVPTYAILSHTWGKEEVTFDDLQPGADNSKVKLKAGWKKIQFCAKQAARDGLEFFWVDTCCIDKKNSVELSAAINSMFRWYQNASMCYVCLVDFSRPEAMTGNQIVKSFSQCRWFNRGWTLQELIAPRSVEFFGPDGERIGDKNSLEKEIHEVTGIAVEALQGVSLSQFSIGNRTAWAAKRETTIAEDQAYSLMGIFGVFLPLIYGEGKENALRRLHEEVQKRSSKCDEVVWTDKESECMRALRTSDYEQFKDRNPERLDGTCQWVLQHKNFQRWGKGESSGLLWVSADPGSGKSVLSKSLIDNDLPGNETRVTCYFFFKDDNQIQSSATTALTALLHQIFSQRPKFITYAMKDHAADGDRLSQSFHKLWGIFTAVLSDPGIGEVICVLDGLDECVETWRHQLIHALTTFCQRVIPTSSRSGLKFLVTSRPYLDIERQFAEITSKYPLARLRGEREYDAISYEIDKVILWTVSNLGYELQLDAKEQSTLKSELLRIPHRTYLWLTLIIDIIRKTLQPTSRRLKAIINTLPSSVDKAYEAMLSKIGEGEKLLARKMFMILLAASRPLTIGEMNIALAIEEDHERYADLDLINDARFEVSLRHISGLFVNVVNQKVYLIHHTAKEFLMPKLSITEKEAHTTLTKICLQFLNFSNIPTTQNRFLEYVSVNWATHLHVSGEDNVDLSQDYLRSTLLWFLHPEQDPERYQAWQRTTRHGYGNLRVFSLSPICFAMRMGLHTLVEMMLPDISDINHRFVDGFTCLAAAASGNQGEMVKKLLELGADIDLPTEDRALTPLHLAAQNACEETVELLIEAGASTQSRSDSGSTPFYRAARGGSIRILSLLHEKGGEVDAATWDGWTPLMEAVENGHEEAVKLLLSLGANPRHRNRRGIGPIELAEQIPSRDSIYHILKAAFKDLPEESSQSDQRSAIIIPQRPKYMDDPNVKSNRTWWTY